MVPASRPALPAIRSCAAVLLAVAAAAPVPARAADSAVIVMYHRFGEAAHPSTNVTIAQFEAHIEELKRDAYSVLPVPRIIDALRHGRPLPERAVGLTIDDAFLTVYTEAWPRLRAAGFPFTLFVATDPVDRKRPGYMTWQQIGELASAGVTIGSQTASHLHMADADAARNRREVADANARFEAELGKRPDLFAYPYGEASLAVQAVIRANGFVAAFGQHSGVFGAGQDLLYLPRFAMNEKYGDAARFKLAVNALSLPITELTPADPMVGAVNPPPVGFTLGESLAGLNRLACFTSHEGRAKIERLGERRFEVRVNSPFPKGRTRLNCTLPSAQAGRWHWFGRQYYVR